MYNFDPMDIIIVFRTLGKVRPSRIERGTLSAFEDFLSALVRGNSEVAAVLKENGVMNVCQVSLTNFCNSSLFFSRFQPS